VLLDVVALILGISYTLRRLGLARVELEGSAPSPGFVAYKELQLSAYRLGATACFAKIVVGTLFVVVLGRLGVGDENWGKRAGSALIDLAWVIGLVLAITRGARARRLKQQLVASEASR
jgi:hypothetical protein